MKNNLKVTNLVWQDFYHRTNFSIIFGGVVYHILYNTDTEEFDVDVGRILTEIVYNIINENLWLTEGRAELKKNFNPHDIIEEQEINAMFAYQQKISNKLKLIYEQ